MTARGMAAPVLLVIGVAAVLLAMLAGRGDLLGAVFAPPLAARILLGLAAFVIGVAIVLRASDQLGTSQEARSLIRAVRLVFVAVGAFAAAAGWVIGSPVPIIAGLVIVGIDLVETSFLLLVTAARGGDQR
jgi:hypothetical protein